MSRQSMLIYAERARKLADPTLASARYAEHSGREPLIVRDIAAKLGLSSASTLLDIGAGVGALTAPLSRMVAQLVAVDHPDCLARLPKDIERMPGNFLDLDFGTRRFSSILIYDVLQYLGDHNEVVWMLHKALGLLAPHGRLLIGDLPNADKKRRFSESAFGRNFVAQWAIRRHDDGSEHLLLEPDRHLVRIDDALVLDVIREASRVGASCRLLAQPPELPFAFVREDLLIEAP